ncbi:NEL-type E3 ubiquitin ligase domain-containing protein [Pseudomonas antarctica]|uniref:NEL-type E3 ubiquitin ligase domain-containing protein n=1 Tax=Pseudomonas antarctica TaxID=219572 RepID=UPI0039C076ED
MVEPITNRAPQDSLSEFIAARQGALMAGPEWSTLQFLDAMRGTLHGFLGALNAAQKLEYVRLQRAWIDAQKTAEKATYALTESFQQQALASLRTELKTLTGQDIDPTVARIHIRYKSLDRERRAADGGQDGTMKVASMTLWNAACMNYNGLTGWSYPGRTGLADASYLDEDIKATADDFIKLVRELNLGGQLQARLDQALLPTGLLGNSIMGLAKAEFEFALIEALKNTTDSRVDRDKYQQVKRALVGQTPWGRVEEMLLFVPHGVDNTRWVPQHVGLTGQYVGQPPGDKLSIAHIVFAVSGSPGAFSFFPNRPGGSLRHHDSHREACEEFHVAFDGLYRRGKVDWLYQIMSLRDSARLIKIAQGAPPPDLEGFAKLLYRLAQSIPTMNKMEQIGYARNAVQKTPVVSLNDFYIERCRANLQALANPTPGFMSNMLELFGTLISEILNVLLIPVPGALKGLGRVRAFAMFVAMEQALIEGAHHALQGQPGELLQGFADLADLLISGRLHTRLAKSVQRRHQALYRQLSEPHGSAPDVQGLTNPELLERMLGRQGTPARDMQALLDLSGTSRKVLNQLWAVERPTASLVDAVQRFQADRLIDWVVEGADPSRPAPLEAVHVMAPLLTQLDAWPAGTALSIENHQGQEIRRYSKGSTLPTTEVVTVTALENYQFAYATPRQLTAHLPQAIVGVLPTIFSAGEQRVRQQLASLATALRIDLFDALTRFAEVSRTLASGASATVRTLLPESIGHEPPVPAVITQLQALHPQLSLARILEVLRDHPLSPHQQEQLLRSQLEPQALYNALRAARQVARQEVIVDGLFYPRRFDQQTQNWACEFATGVLRDLSGQALIVSPAKQAVPYVSNGKRDRSIVVIDELRGRFCAYDYRASRRGVTLTGADSFYEAIINQLATSDLHRLGLNAQQAVTGFRYRVAQAMLSNRALDGSFYPYQRRIERYVHAADTSKIAREPDALGLYRLGTDRYVFIDGEYFKVAEAGEPSAWRIQHPSLDDAYAPVLTHNGAGAWRHEWEKPLTWDGQKPFQRLGPSARALSPDAIDQIQQISGVTPDILRRVHVRNERPPAILRETVERFTLHQRLKTHMQGMDAFEGTAAGRDFFDQLLGEIGPDSADALVGRAGVSRADQVTVLEAKVMTNKPLMERLMFRAMCHKAAQSSDPLAQVVQRVFPSLTAVIAEELVSQAKPVERTELEAGRVPFTFAPSVRWWLHYLRKARALEGVHLPVAANADSAKLILHTLPAIDGWPKSLRVEVWERGRLVDSIGPAGTPLKRVLEVMDGHYQAYKPRGNGERHPIGGFGEFLVVLLGALPARERLALGYTHRAGIEELTQEIARRLESRQVFGEPFGIEKLLGMVPRPWFNPPRRLSDGRIGYPLSGEAGAGGVNPGQVARLRTLYPTKSDAEAIEILRNVADTFEDRQDFISGLFSERDGLNAGLERWCLLCKPVSLKNHLEASERIRRCWSKQASPHGVPHELYLDDLALDSLPQMDANFFHVTLLSLRDNQLHALPAGFLKRFGNLCSLSLDGNLLDHLPEGLSEVQDVRRLNLSNNRIRPDLQDVRYLTTLTRLTHLDLSYNPLGQGQQLNLHRLKALTVLKLRNTYINRLPRGAVTLRKLRTFDLRDNRINGLTETDLGFNLNVHIAMDLQGNELSDSTMAVFNQYRQRPGYQNVYFGMREEQISVSSSVEPWLASTPPDLSGLRRALWSQISSQQTAQNFLVLLGAFASYQPFIAAKNRLLREDITRRVWQLIDSATHDEQVARVLFEESLKYIHGHADGWLLCLNDLELAVLPLQMLAPGSQATAADFLNYYRARRRIASLEYRVRFDYPFHSNVEQSMYLLGCRLALVQALDLPVPLTARFSTLTVQIDALALNEYRRGIINEEAQIDWPDLLKDEEYWVGFLERKYRSAFESARSPYDDQFEQAVDQSERGELGDNAYRLKVDEIGVAMRSSKMNLVLRFTTLEWRAFVSSD